MCYTLGWRGMLRSPRPLATGRAGLPLPDVVRLTTDDLEHVVGIAQCAGAALLVRSGLPAKGHFRRERP